MTTLHLIVIILVGAGLSLLLAYGQTRWFGRKFHRAIYAANVLGIFSIMFFFYLLAWQTTSIWHPSLMVVAALTWLFAQIWTRRLEQAQKKISEGGTATGEERR